MAGSKVPTDPALSKELRTFHDKEARRTDQLETDLATAQADIATLEADLAALTATVAAITDPFDDMLIVRDEKAANTAGGTFDNGADRTRVLNTVVHNGISGASLASNQITLPAGTYYIDASAPAFLVSVNRAWLYDTTGAATLVLGTSEFPSGATTRSHIFGRFTLSAESDLEIRQRCNTSNADDGFGVAANLNSENEVYTTVTIWKV